MHLRSRSYNSGFRAIVFAVIIWIFSKYFHFLEVLKISFTYLFVNDLPILVADVWGPRPWMQGQAEARPGAAGLELRAAGGRQAGLPRQG